MSDVVDLKAFLERADRYRSAIEKLEADIAAMRCGPKDCGEEGSRYGTDFLIETVRDVARLISAGVRPAFDRAHTLIVAANVLERFDKSFTDECEHEAETARLRAYVARLEQYALDADAYRCDECHLVWDCDEMHLDFLREPDVQHCKSCLAKAGVPT